MSVRGEMIVGLTLGLSLVSFSTALAAPCHKPEGATTVISGREGIVFRKLIRPPDADRSAIRRRYWGCLKPNGRLRRLYDAAPEEIYEVTKAGQFRLAGRFVAFVVTSIDHYGGFRRSIVRVDLGGRVPRREVGFGAGRIEGAGGSAQRLEIVRLRLSDSGAVAWLQRDTDFYKPVERLMVLGSRSAEQLDIAADGDIMSISLRGLRLSWLHAGTPRIAELQPPA